MLLTRSPLSPGPKARFSLDLHVLSAPPAFVLSQDQTLREETSCLDLVGLANNRDTRGGGAVSCDRRGDLLLFELELKVSPRDSEEPGVTGLIPHAAQQPGKTQSEPREVSS